MIENFNSLRFKTRDVICDSCTKSIRGDGYKIILGYEEENYHRGGLETYHDTFELCEECKEKIQITLETSKSMKSIEAIFPRKEYVNYKFKRIRVDEVPINAVECVIRDYE